MNFYKNNVRYLWIEKKNLFDNLTSICNISYYIQLLNEIIKNRVYEKETNDVDVARHGRTLYESK